MAHVQFAPVLYGSGARASDDDGSQAAATVAGALRRLGYATDLIRLDLDLNAISRLAQAHPTLVFNLVEGLDGDAALAPFAPAAMEHFRIAFTGADAQAHRLTQSKPAMKRIMVGAGLPTPDWSWDGSGLRQYRRAIVKSATRGGSVGPDAGSVVAASAAWTEVRARTDRFGRQFFAEAYIEGREFSLSLLARKRAPRVLPPAEFIFGWARDRAPILDSDAGWHQGGEDNGGATRRFDYDAEDKALLDRMRAMALDVWRLFGIGSYANVDFRVDAVGTPWIIDLKVNPSLRADAGFAMAAAAAGLGYDELIGEIVAAARVRAASRAA